MDKLEKVAISVFGNGIGVKVGSGVFVAVGSGVSVGGMGEGVNVEGIETGIAVAAGTHPPNATVRSKNIKKDDTSNFFTTVSPCCFDAAFLQSCN